MKSWQEEQVQSGSFPVAAEEAMMSEDQGRVSCAAAGCGLTLSGMWFVGTVLRSFDVDGRHFDGMGGPVLYYGISSGM